MTDLHNETPAVNGTELTDLDAVLEAFAYLREGYNGGDCHKANHQVVKITFRDRHCEHFSQLRESPHVYVSTIYADVQGRQVVEIREEH